MGAQTEFGRDFFARICCHMAQGCHRDGNQSHDARWASPIPVDPGPPASRRWRPSCFFGAPRWLDGETLERSRVQSRNNWEGGPSERHGCPLGIRNSKIQTWSNSMPHSSAARPKLGQGPATH